MAAINVQLLLFPDEYGLASDESTHATESRYSSVRSAVYCLLDGLEEAKDALDKALGTRELFGAPLLVLANKQDKEGALPASEITQSLGLGKLDTRACRVQPVSMLNGNGIREAIRWLVEEIGESDRVLMLRKRAISS